MAQNRFRKPSKLSSNKRNRSKLEYQRFEDRNLLAADLGFGPEALSVASDSIAEYAKRPADSIAQRLAASSETASMQKGLNGLLEVASETNDGQTVTILQQTWNGLPVYGSFVTIVQNDAGEITNVRDQTIRNIRGYANDATPINADQAIAAGTWGLGKPQLMESTAHAAWYYAGNKARLAWVVETSLSNPEGEVVGQFETWVNIFDGEIFAREQLGEKVESLVADPVTETGIFPRIVINDTIGPAGSQAFADQFDSVVSISVGCTGALISPNAVATARHCGIGAGDTVSFGEDSSAPIATFSVESALNPAGFGSLLDGGDFTILTLTEDVPASVATPMRFIDATDDLVGLTAVTAGYGFNGVGSVGHDFSADGLRWAGTNVIDAFGVPASAGGANIISTDFDDGTAGSNTIPTSSLTPLAFEATTAPGDSGGPILVDVNGEWVIAGVLSGGTNAFSLFGDISWWTGTAIYRAEIEAVGGEFVEDASSLGFNQDEYFVGDTIGVRIADGNATGSISITVTSDTGDSESFTASASPTSPGLYEFSFESSNSNIVLNDGRLQVTAGDTIQVTYQDADNGDGVPETLTDTALIREVTASQLIGIDFDLDDTPGSSPFRWLTVTGGSNADFSDLDNEQGGDTPVDFTVNGSWTGLDVDINPSTIPLYPNSLVRVDGQIQTSGESLELVYSDLVASTDYLVYVMAAEGVFDSIEQSVSIQGLGSAVVFEQRFNQGDLFINDQVGDNTRDLEEYAQLITSDINGQITINVSPLAGTQDVVLSGLALVPYAEGIDAVSDVAVTNEDQAVIINVTANDIETNGETISLDSVSTPNNGTATITASGTVNYVPANDFFGTDTFTYVISDQSGNTATGAVTVEVGAGNDAPTGALLSPNLIREDTNTANDVFIGNLTGIDVDDVTHSFQFVAGAGDTDNGLFQINGTAVSLNAGVLLDFDTKPQYSIRVEVSDGDQTFEEQITIAVLEVTPLVTVSINDDAAQRSMVRDTTIAFNEVVTFGANAFELVKRGTDGGAVTVSPVVDNSSGRTVVTLSFSGPFVMASGSLEDGNYELTIRGDQVTTASGDAFDGDGDNIPGGDFVFGDTAGDNFFRHFGDVDGDRLVSALDLLRFRQTWLDSAGDAGFDDRFDYDADGVISTIDLLFFRKNFLDRLDFV